MTRTGEQEMGAVSGRLLDNPGELACMGYCNNYCNFYEQRKNISNSIFMIKLMLL